MIELSPQIFFQPTKKFIDWANNLNLTIVDCGAGMGHLSKCLDNVICIDMIPREGRDPCVLDMDALEFEHFGEKCVALLARPCHGDWVQQVFRKALDKGSRVFYAGLPRNYDDDLDGCEREIIMDGAGEEGEELWEIKRV